MLSKTENFPGHREVTKNVGGRRLPVAPRSPACIALSLVYDAYILARHQDSTLEHKVVKR